MPCFEKPERADFVLAAVRSQRIGPVVEPRSFGLAPLERVHAPRYLAFLEHAWRDWLALEAGNDERQPFPSVWPVRTLRSDIEPVNFIARLGLYSMDNGSPLAAGTWAAAKAGADAAASAAALLAVGQSGERGVFCCSRPPGHHAGPDFMGGYCFLNNAAVAAQTLRDGGAARVAVLDVDYHHGNGTQSIFYERADVLFVSLHGDPLTEYPFYLGHADETGAGEGAGFNLDLPLPAGCTAARWFDALEQACMRIAAYRSDALVPGHPLHTWLAEMVRGAAADLLELGRLSRVEMTSQLSSILGAPPRPDVVDAIWARSGGNAFFAEELLAAMVAGQEHLPPTLRQVLLARIGNLSAAASTVLAMVATAGSPVRFHMTPRHSTAAGP